MSCQGSARLRLCFTETPKGLHRRFSGMRHVQNVICVHKCHFAVLESVWLERQSLIHTSGSALVLTQPMLQDTPEDLSPPHSARTTRNAQSESDPNCGPATVQIFSRHGAHGHASDTSAAHTSKSFNPATEKPSTRSPVRRLKIKFWTPVPRSCDLLRPILHSG
jgi:hypothetical protein